MDTLSTKNRLIAAIRLTGTSRLPARYAIEV